MTLAYDALGRLYSTSGGAEGTRYYQWDGSSLVTEYSTPTTQAAVERHVHGPSGDEPLITSTTSVGLGMVFADERGSVVGVYDAANPANGVQTQGYGTWGETGSAGLTTGRRFGYAGQIWLPAAQAYHNRARLYEPKLGIFMGPDPIGTDGGVNLYGYAAGDPINNKDPGGLDIFDDILGLFGFAPATSSCDLACGGSAGGGGATAAGVTHLRHRQMLDLYLGLLPPSPLFQ